MRILVVDDDNGKVVDVVKVVEQAGIDSSAIEVATTAASALKMLEANTYDLLGSSKAHRRASYRRWRRRARSENSSLGQCTCSGIYCGSHCG